MHICIIVLHFVFIPLILPLRWYHIVYLIILSPVISFFTSFSYSAADWSIVSTSGPIIVFLIAAWSSSFWGGSLVGLTSCVVLLCVGMRSSTIIEDFKIGYLSRTSPRLIFIGHTFGILLGSVVGVSVYFLKVKSFPIGTSLGRYNVPYGTVYRGMDFIANNDWKHLPQNCFPLSIMFFFISIFLNILHEWLEKKKFSLSQYVPDPVALAISFLGGPYFVISMLIGFVIDFIWRKY